MQAKWRACCFRLEYCSPSGSGNSSKRSFSPSNRIRCIILDVSRNHCLHPHFYFGFAIYFFEASTVSETPTFEDIISLVVHLVPDLPKPTEIMAEIESKDRLLWLEGWCDGCIAGKGFLPKGEGMLQEKLDYIRNLTPEFMKERAKKRGMIVQWSGFLPLSDKEFLYGVSWAIFKKES